MTKFLSGGNAFTPFSASYIEISGGVITFDVGHYNSPGTGGTRATNAFTAMASLLMNTVYLYYWPDNAGAVGGSGIDLQYAANVADAIIRARNVGLKVILSIGGLPLTGTFARPSSGSIAPYNYDANWVYLTNASITARTPYIQAILAQLQTNGIVATDLLAIQFTGEIDYNYNTYPFDPASSALTITTKTGSYSMASTAARTLMARNEIQSYISQISTIIKNAFPGVPTMVQINAPLTFGPPPDLANAILSSDADSYGLSLYPTYGHSFDSMIASFNTVFPIPDKPVMMLETGWFPGYAGMTIAQMAAASVQWLSAGCRWGVFGENWYTWDGSDPSYVAMTASGNTIASALSPLQVGDGCTIFAGLGQFQSHGARAYEIVIQDQADQSPNVVASMIGGVTNYYQVLGPAIAATGVRFHPEGSILDQIGSSSFRVPLTDQRNNALTRGARFTIREKGSGIEMHHGIVLKRAITGGVTGEYAQITGVDRMDELRRTSVTTGFSTKAITGETLVVTGTRLCNLATAAGFPWVFVTDLGAAYDGLGFTATGNVGQAFANLANSRHAHFKHSPSVPGTNLRVINFGVFGQDCGLTLMGGLANPTLASVSNEFIRVIEDGSPQISQDYNIINHLTPYGAGSGIGQISLRPLYDINSETILPNGWRISNNTNFQGFIAGYPIYRRPRQDEAGDGFEYFIYEPLSYALTGDGPWEAIWSQSQIAVGGTGSPADFITAASYLYVAAVSHMKWNNVPQEVYTLTTDGHGDLRDIAGKQIRMMYRGIGHEKTMQDGQEAKVVNMDVNGLFTVMSCEISQDDNAVPHATWTLSNNQKYEITDTSVTLGALEQIQYGNFTAPSFPLDREFPIDEFLDLNHPINFPVPGNLGTALVVEAKLSLYVRPAQMPVMPNPHAHTAPLAAIPHDVAALPHDVTTLPSHVTPLPLTYRIGGATVQSPVEYEPSVTLTVQGGSTPSGSVPVMFDGHNFYAPGKGHDIILNAEILTILNTTDAPTGATVNATTGAATGTGQTGGTVAKTTGGKGGTITASDPLAKAHKTTTKSAIGDPNLDAQGMTWGMYLNPASLPTVHARIGNVDVGDVTTAGKLDATAALNANGAGTVDFSVAISVGAAPGGNPLGLCRVYGSLQMRVVIGSIGKIGSSI